MAKTYVIKAPIHVDFRQKKWTLERMVLDDASNHLPSDSGGSSFSVLIKQDGVYLPLAEADPKKKTDEVIVEDDGTGYHTGYLEVLASDKPEGAAGQFGFGLKGIGAAAVRNGVGLEYRSQNWSASPRGEEEQFGTEKRRRLCFDIKENEQKVKGSRTIYKNPSDALLQEIFSLQNNVLLLNPSYRELSEPGGYFSGYPSRIIELGNTQRVLFVKGVKNQKGINAIFSYDLGLSRTSFEREFADRDEVIEGIGYLLKNKASKEAIERVLRVAQAEPDSDYFEFRALRSNAAQKSTVRIVYDDPGKEIKINENIQGTLPEFFKKYDIAPIEKRNKFAMPKDEKKEAWRSAFHGIYGADAVLASEDTNENTDAQSLGYTPIKLNKNVHNYLTSVGIKTAQGLVNEQQYRWVSEGQLTLEERAILAQKKEVDLLIFGEDRGYEVRVFSGAYNKAGREVTTQTGVQITDKDGQKYIGIKRIELSNLERFVNVYAHEAGHWHTGKGDFERPFVDFAYKALARLVSAVLDTTPKKG